MSLPGASPASATPDVQEPPFAPAHVEELLRLLVKAVRAHQLYLPNNPVYHAAVDAVRGAFAPLWDRTDEVTLRFSENDIRWFGVPVLEESERAADSLPWTFYKDGVRAVTLTPGFEQEELVQFFDILQRVRKAGPEDDDLLTLLWESDFAHLRYRYVDMTTDMVPGLEAGDPPPAAVDPEGVRAAAREPLEESRSPVVNMQDFDATLYFLDEKELEYLRNEITREYDRDLRRAVVSTLLDIYEAQTAPAIREEVSDLLETMLLLLLASGQLETVAWLLSETQVVVSRAADLTDAQRDRLGRLPERLSAPEPLRQLLQALDEAADSGTQPALAALFGQLHPTALGTILAAIPRMQSAQVRTLVEQAADRLAREHTAELVALILAPDAQVAMEAVRRASAMKTGAAVAPLARLLAEAKDAALRLAGVQALTEIGSPGAFQALERSIADADRDVRVAAVRALGARAHRGVFSRLDAVVRNRELRDADLTEKMAFFEAFGALCGDGGVAFLDGLLNGKGIFGRREDPELRACAAMALGRVATARARDALQRAMGEKDVIVRNAVTRALRGGPA